MKILPLLVPAFLLLALGTASLFAEPEQELAPALGLSEALEVSPEQAEALAKAIAEKPRWQLRIDATFLRVDGARADEVLGEHRPDPEGSARAIPGKLARQLVGLARGRGAVCSEPLPPLLLHDGQRGRLSATGHHTYIQDYDVEIGGFSSSLGNAIVGQITDGTGVVVLPHRADEGLLLDVDAVWAEVIRPVPLFETSLAAAREGPTVTIELPEMRLFQVRKQVELPVEGGYVLAGGGRPWDGETLRLVVLEVRSAKR